MVVSKWGDGLAVRLPDAVVEALGLKEGDQVELRPASDDVVEVSRAPGNGLTSDRAARKEAIMKLRALRGLMPADFKFDREEANER